MTTTQILSHAASEVGKVVSIAMAVLAFAIVVLVGAVVLSTVELTETPTLPPGRAPIASTTIGERSIDVDFGTALGGIARIDQQPAQGSPQDIPGRSGLYPLPSAPRTPQNGSTAVSAVPIVSDSTSSSSSTQPPTTRPTSIAPTVPSTTPIPTTVPPTEPPTTPELTAPPPTDTIVPTSPPTTDPGTTSAPPST